MFGSDLCGRGQAFSATGDSSRWDRSARKTSHRASRLLKAGPASIIAVPILSEGTGGWPS